jgi:hypothetical protein
MAAVRRGWVDVVVCFKLDRLGRGLSHLAQIIDEFNTHKVALVVPAQGIDTSDDNPAGKLQLHILSAVAEFEREIMHHFSGLSLCNSKVILRGGFSCNATRVGGGQLARNREKLSFKAGGKHALSQPAWAARHGHRKFFSSPGMATLCSHHSTQCHCVGECRWGPSILMARCISVMSRCPLAGRLSLSGEPTHAAPLLVVPIELGLDSANFLDRISDVRLDLFLDRLHRSAKRPVIDFLDR